MDGFQTWKNGAGGCNVHGIHAGLSQLCRLLVEAGELVFLCVTVSSVTTPVPNSLLIFPIFHPISHLLQLSLIHI